VLPTFVILIVCFASIALADDFKTTDGKEYKNVTVSRVEPDGIVLITSSGISKVYFTELPKEVQERFNYDAAKAAAYSAEQVANSEAFSKQRQESERQRVEEREKYWNEHPTPEPQRHLAGLTGSALDRDAGPNPEQLEDGTIVSLDQQIRRWLLDPDSLIYESWGELKVGQSPGGNPAWTVTVKYRAKNAYGAYAGNTTASYWLKDGLWNMR
jgi:hypothetical protein